MEAKTSEEILELIKEAAKAEPDLAVFGETVVKILVEHQQLDAAVVEDRVR